MVMRAGLLRDIADVQEHNGKVENGQATLERDGDWTTIIAGLRIYYRDVSGGETIRGRQMEATTTGLIQTWSTPETRAITSGMRLLMYGRKLNIVSNLDLEGKNEEQTIQVEEKR